MFHISVSNRQDWKQFWSHQHSCYWQQDILLGIVPARGWQHSKRQQQTPTASLSNPAPKSCKTSNQDATIASLHLKPPGRHCSHFRVNGTVHYIYNYGLLYLLFTKTCFVSMPENPDFLTGGRAAGPTGYQGGRGEKKHTHNHHTAFRNKIYSNFKQRVYFRRKIWKSISIRYFCNKRVAQQSEWDHSKKQSHSWTGMRQFGVWIDPDTGHLIQKLLYPTLFPPRPPTRTTIHALQMTRFKNSILYSILFK